MKIQTSEIVGLVILYSLASSTSMADPTMDVVKAVTAAYSRCDAASASRDAVATLAIDTQSYLIVDAAGKVLFKNGPKMLAQYRKTYSGATQVRQKTTVEKMSLKGNTVKATVLQRLQLSAIDSSINNWRTWVIDWRMEDTWGSFGGVWKRTRTVMVNQSSSKRVGPVQ